jgi:hypothetical protein
MAPIKKIQILMESRANRKERNKEKNNRKRTERTEEEKKTGTTAREDIVQIEQPLHSNQSTLSARKRRGFVSQGDFRRLNGQACQGSILRKTNFSIFTLKFLDAEYDPFLSGVLMLREQCLGKCSRRGNAF